MFGLGFFEILVILAIILVVVGPDKLPQLAQTLGRTMWQLRRAAEEFKGEVTSSGFTFDASAIRKEVNELKNLLVDDSRRFGNQVIQPPPQLAPPIDSQPHEAPGVTSPQSGDVAVAPTVAQIPVSPTSILPASANEQSNETPPSNVATPTNDTAKG